MPHLFLYHLFSALFQCLLVIFFGDGVGIRLFTSRMPRTKLPNIMFCRKYVQTKWRIVWQKISIFKIVMFENNFIVKYKSDSVGCFTITYKDAFLWKRNRNINSLRVKYICFLSRQYNCSISILSSYY